MENLQKVLKIKFQLKIDIPCQKDHKSRLKSRYWDRTPHPPFGGEGGVKTPQNTDFGNFRVILPLPAILQAKMNTTIAQPSACAKKYAELRKMQKLNFHPE